MSDGIVNHVGICVTDIERSRRFYRDLLGFEDSWRLTPPDSATSALLRVDPPVNLTAVYLTRGPFVLELLHYDRSGNPAPRERPLNEPGLTHISFAVDDIAATCARVEALGGTIASSICPAVGKTNCAASPPIDSFPT